MPRCSPESASRWEAPLCLNASVTLLSSPPFLPHSNAFTSEAVSSLKHSPISSERRPESPDIAVMALSASIRRPLSPVSSLAFMQANAPASKSASAARAGDPVLLPLRQDTDSMQSMARKGHRIAAARYSSRKPRGSAEAIHAPIMIIRHKVPLPYKPSLIMHKSLFYGRNLR